MTTNRAVAVRPIKNLVCAAMARQVPLLSDILFPSQRYAHQRPLSVAWFHVQDAAETHNASMPSRQ